MLIRHIKNSNLFFAEQSCTDGLHSRLMPPHEFQQIRHNARLVFEDQCYQVFCSNPETTSENTASRKLSKIKRGGQAASTNKQTNKQNSIEWLLRPSDHKQDKIRRASAKADKANITERNQTGKCFAKKMNKRSLAI
jgi:hypothetical protein